MDWWRDTVNKVINHQDPKIRGIPRINNDSFYKITAPSGSLPMDGWNPLTQVKVLQLMTDKTLL